MRSSRSERVLVVAGVVSLYELRQGPAAAPARAWLEIRYVEPQVGRLVEGTLEAAPGEEVGEVDQGAGGGGDWDAVLGGDVGVGQRRAVDDHGAPASPLAAAGHGHVDARRRAPRAGSAERPPLCG